MFSYSDDEPVILADSKIITLSFGSERSIVFKQIHDPNSDETVLSPKPNSMYTMTRSSQAWYKHGIPKTKEQTHERFSITLRTVSSKFSRSILLMGDSNTKDVIFGSGKGFVGESFPGRRVKAAHVDQIDPVACIGFAHIVLACGTNNMRIENPSSRCPTPQIVETLMHKIAQIKKLCPNCTITVMPVLPSRLPKMNANIVRYNELVDRMLSRSFPDIGFPSMQDFLDSKNLLSTKYSRDNNPIHLSERGIAKFVSVMKYRVYERECMNRRNSKPVPAPD